MSLQAKQERRRKFAEDLAKRQGKDVEVIVRENALPCLPAKSLLKFRVVCKDWCQLIATPFFTHNQSHKFRKMSGLFHQSQMGGLAPAFIPVDVAAYGVPDPSLSFLPVPVNIKSSTNGLLLCQGQTGEKRYYVCNPVNMQWKVLPKQTCDHGSDPAVVLVFEPSVLNFSADYKVVCAIASVEFPDATEFEIYSSEKNSWKLSREICFNQKVVPTSGLYVDKTVYWQSSRAILAFDPISEHAVTHGAYASYRSCYIEMNGQLCYGSLAGKKLSVYPANLYQNTMPMNMYGSKPKLDVVVDILSPGNTSGARDYMGNREGAQVLPSVSGDVLVFKTGGTITSYNICTKQFKDLHKSESGQDYFNGRFFAYVNSLVSVSSI
ncbi:hypothetical protein IFM89_016231 [Coptis chinensis]|uniref:F-box protein n=1 Tax=Coptis chinensis TaxID=261450 RepID=A0A835M3J5_9MAGN|nr:hypothetical protein IFM89_016231 [Coptis chinensis]